MRHSIINQDSSVIDDDGVGKPNCAVRSSVDNKLVTVDENIGVKARGEAIERFVACALEELRGRHASFVAVGDDHNVAADFFLDTAEQNVI